MRACELTAAGTTPAGPRLAQCEQALGQCRAPAASAWLSLARAAAGQLTDAGSRPIDSRAVTPELQQDLLSQIAREHLRREWERKKAEVVEGVLRDLRDPQKQRGDFEKEVEQYTSVLGVERHGQFAERYQAIRARRTQALERALGADPPDFATALAELKGLYADEDQLAAALAGKDAVARFRLSQLDPRTVVLGIAATYAQVPWDQSIYP